MRANGKRTLAPALAGGAEKESKTPRTKTTHHFTPLMFFTLHAGSGQLPGSDSPGLVFFLIIHSSIPLIIATTMTARP